MICTHEYLCAQEVSEKQQYFKATKFKITLFFICIFGMNNGSGFLSQMLCQSLISIQPSALVKLGLTGGISDTYHYSLSQLSTCIVLGATLSGFEVVCFHFHNRPVVSVFHFHFFSEEKKRKDQIIKRDFET